MLTAAIFSDIISFMTQQFENWTEYDTWLIQNYNDFAVTSVNETDGKVTIEYMSKSDWEALQKSPAPNKN